MILADGCFDPLHAGHLRYLQAARFYGRPLVVRLASDAAIRAKGREPYQTRQERGQLVWALDVVDRVVFEDPLAHAIRVYKPEFLIKGIEWRDRLPSDVLEACQQTGTRVVYVNERYRSTTDRLACLMPKR